MGKARRIVPIVAVAAVVALAGTGTAVAVNHSPNHCWSWFCQRPTPTPKPTTPKPTPTPTPTTPRPTPTPTKTQPSPTPTPTTPTPTTPAPTPTSGALPAPVDLGNSLSAYINAAQAGQVVVVPKGKTLTGGTISNVSRSTWAFVLAEEPGTVSISSPVMLSGVKNVVLGGFTFEAGVWPYAGSSVGLWYSDVTGVSGRAAVNAVSNGSVADKFLMYATNVHDSDHDTVKSNISNFVWQGGRGWGAYDPTGVNHDDTFQSQAGTSQVIADDVFGLTPQGMSDGNGHSQIQSDLGQVSVTYSNVWITASGNYAITADDKGKNSLHLTVTGVRAWDNNFGDGKSLIHTALSVSGSTVSETGTVFAAPSPSDIPPDVAWQSAHPYTTVVGWFAGK